VVLVVTVVVRRTEIEFRKVRTPVRRIGKKASAQGFADSRARKQRLRKYIFGGAFKDSYKMPLWKNYQAVENESLGFHKLHVACHLRLSVGELKM